MTDETVAGETTPSDTTDARTTAPARRRRTGNRKAAPTGARPATRAKSIARPPEVREALEEAEEEVDERIEGLTKQVRDLGAQLALLTSQASEGAHELVDVAGRQIGRAASATRRNPLPAAVGLGILLLLTAVLASRHEERWR